jgi:tetratricopeptide (TPR) repeat protein
LGNALLYQARYNDALVHLEKANSLSRDSKCNLGFWGYGCAVAGLREKAERVSAKLTSLPGHEYVPSYFVGLIHLGLGRTDKAIHWLNRACDERTHWVIFLNSDPTFDGIRALPRFQELSKRSMLKDFDGAASRKISDIDNPRSQR